MRRPGKMIQCEDGDGTDRTDSACMQHEFLGPDLGPGEAGGVAWRLGVSIKCVNGSVLLLTLFGGELASCGG